ncbi:MAG: hypothetical protein GC165_06130 [Armatimonadetes bacterium]|nr:hypothetical protein [Armatimonadota bacterium]MBS1726065.1 hypothetical protein [Armatimonadota bacterium]
MKKIGTEATEKILDRVFAIKQIRFIQSTAYTTIISVTGVVAMASFFFLAFTVLSPRYVTNGPSHVFPEEPFILPTSIQQKLSERLKEVFRKPSKIIIHLTNRCTTCTLGPQIEEVGQYSDHIQMVYMQDYPPKDFSKGKAQFVISDPDGKYIPRSQAVNLPRTYEVFLDGSTARWQPLTDMRQWRKRI